MQAGDSGRGEAAPDIAHYLNGFYLVVIHFFAVKAQFGLLSHFE